ncbi:MAG TPA: hypothetical protein VFF22_08950 [Pseudomonas sp.]|nr:hypothetical protein [Pseudomonas sp.]
MDSKKKCGMCSSSEPLQNSHIIPRSYFRSLKNGCGQLYEVSSSEKVKSKLTNSDPKEELLCLNCEQFLSLTYEKYGTRLLKDEKIKYGKAFVIFKSFRYKEFYLYLISILWRASISKIARYDHIDLGNSINSLLCHCVKNNTIKIQTSLRLDHFFRISLIRIKDDTKKLDDNILRKAMFDINSEPSKNREDGVIYYFMVDGFLIIYHISCEDDTHKLRTKKNYAQISNTTNMKVPVSDISNFKQIADGFNSIRSKSN